MTETYTRGQDYLSAAKLNYLHYALKQLAGYNLHPVITHSYQPKAIADLGTQTAIWAIDVAESCQVEVDAFDISARFVPPPAWLPNNVKFRIHNIQNPFPDDLHGKYDVVHFRLFLNLTSPQLRDMLAAAFTILAPGGYVQWTEHDKTNLKLAIADVGATTEAADAFIDVQQHPFPDYNPHWVNEIGPAMVDAGFQVMAEDRLQTKDSMLLQLHELHLIALTDVPPGLSPQLDYFKDQYFNDLAHDHARGVAVRDGYICVVGRKAQ